MFITFFACCNQYNKPATNTVQAERKDTLPMEMSYQEIKEKSQYYLALFGENKKFTVEEYIDIIRAYNTIAKNDLIDKDTVFFRFYDTFLKKQMADALPLFDMTVSRGLGYHSKKYNLDIGGVPNENSVYRLKE